MAKALFALHGNMALDERFVSVAIKNLQDVMSRKGLSPEALFAKYDYDGNGYLSYDEFANSLESMTGQKAPKPVLDVIFSTIDTDKNNNLDLNELISIFGGSPVISNSEIVDANYLILSGHSDESYNGPYEKQRDLINDKPYFKNFTDQSEPKILYYYNATSGGAPSWSLDNRNQNGSKDLYRGGWTRASPDGKLPLGEKRWVGVGKITLSISNHEKIKSALDSNESISNELTKDFEESMNDIQEMKESMNQTQRETLGDIVPITQVQDESKIAPSGWDNKTGKEQLEYIIANNKSSSDIGRFLSELSEVKDSFIKGVNDESLSIEEGRSLADMIFNGKINNLPSAMRPLARNTWEAQANAVEISMRNSFAVAAVGGAITSASIAQINANSNNGKTDIPQQTNKSNISNPKIEERDILNSIDNIANESVKIPLPSDADATPNSTSEEVISSEIDTLKEVLDDFANARFISDKRKLNSKYEESKFILNIKVIEINRSFGIDLDEEYKGGKTLLANTESGELEIRLKNSDTSTDYRLNSEYEIHSTFSGWNSVRNRLILNA